MDMVPYQLEPTVQPFRHVGHALGDSAGRQGKEFREPHERARSDRDRGSGKLRESRFPEQRPGDSAIQEGYPEPGRRSGRISSSNGFIWITIEWLSGVLATGTALSFTNLSGIVFKFLSYRGKENLFDLLADSPSWVSIDFAVLV